MNLVRRRKSTQISSGCVEELHRSHGALGRF
jgi:hypothetical protein